LPPPQAVFLSVLKLVVLAMFKSIAVIGLLYCLLSV
jgi:hypothetical protein